MEGNRVKGPVVDCLERRSLETLASERKMRAESCMWVADVREIVVVRTDS